MAGEGQITRGREAKKLVSSVAFLTYLLTEEEEEEEEEEEREKKEEGRGKESQQS